MDIVKKNIDDLFSKADHLNPSELSHSFNDIMKTGEKAIELSGKNYLFFMNIFRHHYKNINFRK